MPSGRMLVPDMGGPPGGTVERRRPGRRLTDAGTVWRGELARCRDAGRRSRRRARLASGLRPCRRMHPSRPGSRRSKSTNSRAARPTSSLTTTSSNSRAAASSSRARARRRAIAASSSVPRPRSRASSSAKLGGRQEDQQRLGHRGAHLPRALQLDLQQHGLARGQPPLDRRRGACRTGCRRTPPTPGSRPSATARVELLARSRSGSAAPSTSPGRGARVVAETDTHRSGRRVGAAWATTVPLPTPLGPVRTTRRPAGRVAGEAAARRRPIIDGRRGPRLERSMSCGDLARAQAPDATVRGDPDPRP